MEHEGNEQKLTCRNSEDKKENPRGKELLDICKINDLIVVNGRKAGDIFGKYTCHNWNGSSVVDYLLCPTSFFGRINKFLVGEYIPWLSDHCIIKSVITLSGNLDVCVENEESTEEVHPGYVWTVDSLFNFKAGLQGQETVEKIQALVESNYVGAKNLAKEIQNILSENIGNCEVKSKKAMSNPGSEPWFDKECELEKKNLKTMARKMKINPNEEARRKVFDTKKEFKKIILAKKRGYRGKIFAKLQGERQEGNEKEFWKILRKISPKSKRCPSQPNLSELRKYFENLSKSDRELDFPDKVSKMDLWTT